jgi:hypothetical protein
VHKLRHGCLTIDSDLEPFSGTVTKGTLEFVVEIEHSIRVNKVNKRLNILLELMKRTTVRAEPRLPKP